MMESSLCYDSCDCPVSARALVPSCFCPGSSVLSVSVWVTNDHPCLPVTVPSPCCQPPSLTDEESAAGSVWLHSKAGPDRAELAEGEGPEPPETSSGAELPDDAGQVQVRGAAEPTFSSCLYKLSLC